MDKLNIAIADDEKLFRSGIKMILEESTRFKVLLEAENGQELLDNISQDNFPDLILLDLSMPVLDGIKTLEILIGKYPTAKIIILTSHYDATIIVKLIEMGASSFLAKNTHPDLLIEAINKVIEKGFHYTDYILELLREKMLYGGKREGVIVNLSDREEEVLKKLCDQKTTKEIADELYISPRTVEGHRNNLLHKTQAKNLAGLIIYAIENGIYSVKMSTLIL